MDFILVAGMWLDGRAWQDVIPALSALGHGATAVTLPGQGPDAGKDAALDDQLDHLLGVLDAAESPVALVGHSAAATLVWMAADRRPDKVARVIMIGGHPASEGENYFDVFAPVDGWVRFPGWSHFDGPDVDDLDDEKRAQLDQIAVPVAAGVTHGQVTYSNPQRHATPVTEICPEFSPQDAVDWLEKGNMPELAEVEHLSLVDIDSGHWPMTSKPAELAALLHGIADGEFDVLDPEDAEGAHA